MLETWQPLPLDASMTMRVIRHPTASPRSVVLGLATDAVDLTSFVENISQRGSEYTIKLRWHMELYVAGAQPHVDEVIEIKMNDQQMYIGIIQQISDYGEQRGERRMSIVARSRDNTPLWRDTQAQTQAYSIATDLMVIVNEILDTMGMTVEERVLPPSLGVYTVHTTTQMAGMTAWDMLTTLLEPAGYDPYIDALGRFRIISRDTNRAPARVLDATRMLSVVGSKSKPQVTRIRIKWLDPNLSKSSGQDQALGGATITAGFFQERQTQDVYFSRDRAQRAENTRLVIKQTCNSGLLPVASENYTQVDEMHGQIELDTYAWVPILATASLAAMLALDWEPDLVVGGFGGGETIPVGRVSRGVAEGILLLTMMSLGTGVYEVWGTPFYYVHSTNKTEAYDNTAPAWSDKTVEIANDFVMNEAQAQAYATRELVYQALSASTHTISIVEDPSIERGDILQLPDGSRFYVTDYSRDIGRGKSHTLSLDGFRV